LAASLPLSQLGGRTKPYLNLRPEQTNIFFKLTEERYRQRATIIATNLDYSE